MNRWLYTKNGVRMSKRRRIAKMKKGIARLIQQDLLRRMEKINQREER